MKTMGDVIKEVRKQNGYTLKDISKKANISISFLSDIENNRSSMPVERLQSIAKALNVTATFLLGEDDYSDKIKVKDYLKLIKDKEVIIKELLEECEEENYSSQGIMNKEIALDRYSNYIITEISNNVDLITTKNESRVFYKSIEVMPVLYVRK